jgi:NMD protein affecting ribosome stability and mRNA decay
MNYCVQRGLREIVAPTHRLTAPEWKGILRAFANRCAFCGERKTAANRGLVPDHLLAARHHGELVPGNAVPACQRCNDSRGEQDWRQYLQLRFPDQAVTRAALIDSYLASHVVYKVATPENNLTIDEQAEYSNLLADWEKLRAQAYALKERVTLRRQATSAASIEFR